MVALYRPLMKLPCQADQHVTTIEPCVRTRFASAYSGIPWMRRRKYRPGVDFALDIGRHRRHALCWQAGFHETLQAHP